MNVRATKRKHARMKTSVAYLQKYMDTYPDQVGYENYSDKTLIDDVLYGLGVALDPENNRYANGFMRFKNVLREHLDCESQQKEEIADLATTLQAYGVRITELTTLAIRAVAEGWTESQLMAELGRLWSEDLKDSVDIER